MPCFDRKLEAFRPDLTVDFGESTYREVDHVLATYELSDLLENYVPDTDFDWGFNNLVNLEDNEYNVPVTIGNGSGGMAVNVFMHACKEIYGVSVEYLTHSEGNIDWRVDSEAFGVKHEFFRSSDYVQWSLCDKTTEKKVLTFSQVYGFKNIQNFVNRLKRRKKMDEFPVYLEIMACPGRGCLNGGGQFAPGNKTTNDRLNSRLQLKLLDSLYNSLPNFPSQPQLVELTKKIHTELRTDKANLYRHFYKLEKGRKQNSVDW